MLRYLGARSATAAITLVIVSVLVFLILRVVPGDVATLILQGPDGAGGADPAQVAQLNKDLGLDRPLVVQYLDWAREIAVLDLGRSLWSKSPISHELASRIPLTVELALLATGLTTLIGVPLGVISALRPGGVLDSFTRLFTAIGLSVPNFWLGTVLIIILLHVLNWTPPLGYEQPWTSPLKNLQQMILPAVALSLQYSCVITRMMRSSLIDVLSEDYIRTATAKGLGRNSVVIRHALRNAALPVFTLLSLQVGHLLGGTVVLETVFNLPGVGRYMVESISHRDYPVIQSLIFLFAVVFITINILTDAAYGLFDPRTRVQ